jgi:hypothetical protein
MSKSPKIQRSLICITTCNRFGILRSLIWDYVDFCRKRSDYDLVISLDGIDRKTINYCKKHRLPLVYSEFREGVGLSKNRILERYPDYDYYFFIEDDVRLVDSAVFDMHIRISGHGNIAHFSMGPEDRLLDEGPSVCVQGLKIRRAWYGTAQFCFFTKDGIDKVGGFDVEFAKYKRFGHTEHSYRFVYAGLSEYPFNVIDECQSGYLEWTEPRSVTNANVNIGTTRLYEGEENMIKEKVKWKPLKTLSKYHSPPGLDLANIIEDQWVYFFKAVYCIRLLAENIYRFPKRLVKKVIKAF